MLNPLGGSEVCVLMNLSAEPAWRQRQAGFLMQQAEIVTPPAVPPRCEPHDRRALESGNALSMPFQLEMHRK